MRKKQRQWLFVSLKGSTVSLNWHSSPSTWCPSCEIVWLPWHMDYPVPVLGREKCWCLWHCLCRAANRNTFQKGTVNYLSYFLLLVCLSPVSSCQLEVELQPCLVLRTGVAKGPSHVPLFGVLVPGPHHSMLICLKKIAVCWCYHNFRIPLHRSFIGTVSKHLLGTDLISPASATKVHNYTPGFFSSLACLFHVLFKKVKMVFMVLRETDQTQEDR